MLNFFKRIRANSSRTAAQPPAGAVAPTPSGWHELSEPIPLPEVREGNEDADWALWEDSVMEQLVEAKQVAERH